MTDMRAEAVTRFVDGVFGNVGDAEHTRIESALEPRTLTCGEVLFEQGSEPESIAFVTSGRLEVFRTEIDGDERTMGEIGRGQSVGEVGVVSGRPRPASVRALRPTELLTLPRSAFEVLQAEMPGVVIPLMRAIASRLDRLLADRRPYVAPETTAVVPLHAGAPAAEIAESLADAARRYGPTHVIDAQRCDAALGKGAADQPLDGPDGPRIRRYLDKLDDDHDVDLYIATPDASNWTLRCLARADRILLVANADHDPAKSHIETVFGEGGELPNHCQRELILVHPADTVRPSGTAKWLEAREVVRHHHVRQGSTDDMARVARRLLGKAVTVVLSGGAARGMVHLGVVKALHAAGVPIDSSGGASAGGGVAVLTAAGFSAEEMQRSITESWIESGVFHDFTVPMVSILNSKALRRGVQHWLGELGMEDLWADGWCVAANLTKNRPEILDSGPAWFSIMATAAIPGVFPPVYRNGDVLVDGGVHDNFPVETMVHRAPGTLVACDVGLSRGLRADTALSLTPSPWRILFRKLNPMRANFKLPGLGKILFATASASSVLRQTDAQELCRILLRPNTSNLPGLSFDNPTPMIELGYRETSEAIESVGVDVLLGLK